MASTNPATAYDIESQYKRVLAYLIPGENLAAVYDCKGGGTGFVGVTDRRIIFYDQGIVLKKKSMVSIAYNQIVAIASTDEGIIFQTSEITVITTGNMNFQFTFRGADKAHWVYQYICHQLLTQANPQLRG
jgi:hypothetical protein